MYAAGRRGSSGVKTWDLACRIRGTGKSRRLSLGRTTDIGLERARERAKELTSAARSGRDLVAEEEDARGAAASRITVEKLIDSICDGELLAACAQPNRLRAV